MDSNVGERVLSARQDRSDLRVAAVIPLYNGAAFIARALASVRDQTWPADEVVVVDDGSSDDGAAAVLRLAREWPSLRLVRKPNGGQSSARNAGATASRARLIAFLDQDDYWYPDHIEVLIDPFRRSGAPTGWSYADVDVGDEAGTLLVPRFLHTRPARHPKTSVRECMATDMFVLPSASLVSRTAFEAVGGFDETLSGYEDDDLFLRMLEAGYDNVFIDRPLSMWRIYGRSTTFTPAMARSRLRYAHKLLARFGGRPGPEGAGARGAIAPRFARSLLGEYRRAASRNDADAMTACLDDIRRWFLPHLPASRRLALQAVLPLLGVHPVGRLLASERVVGAFRRLAGLPQPPHAGV